MSLPRQRQRDQSRFVVERPGGVATDEDIVHATLPEPGRRGVALDHVGRAVGPPVCTAKSVSIPSPGTSTAMTTAAPKSEG